MIQLIIDPKAHMSFEQLQQFFSATLEFQLKQVDDKTAEIKIESEDVPGKFCSLRMYLPALSVQQIIRTITQLMWNVHHNNFD